MVKVSWNIWKMTFPYKCSIRGYLSHDRGYIGLGNPSYCEFCGGKDCLVKTSKKDYKEKNKKEK